MMHPPVDRTESPPHQAPWPTTNCQDVTPTRSAGRPDDPEWSPNLRHLDGIVQYSGTRHVPTRRQMGHSRDAGHRTAQCAVVTPCTTAAPRANAGLAAFSITSMRTSVLSQTSGESA